MALFNTLAFGQTQLITNGGYETGSTGWVFSGGAGVYSGDVARSGGYFLWMGGDHNLNETAYQTVYIPSNATSATLSFWYNITSNEGISTAYDTLSISIRNTNGSILRSLTTLANTDKHSGQGNPYYQQANFDLLAYAGQTIWIYFVSSTDSSDLTHFRIDDVSLLITEHETIFGAPYTYDLGGGWSWNTLYGYIYLGFPSFVYVFETEEWLWVTGDSEESYYFWRFGVGQWGWTGGPYYPNYVAFPQSMWRPYIVEGLVNGIAATFTDDEQIGAIAVHESGDWLGVLTSKDDQGNITAVEGAVFRGVDGTEITVFCGDDGLPERLVVEGYVILFSNYTDSTVDIAEIAPNGNTTISRSVPINTETIDIIKGLLTEDEGQLFGLSKMSALSDSSYWTLPRVIRIGTAVVSGAFCAYAIVQTAGLAAIPCASTIIGGLRAFLPEDHALLESFGFLFDVVGCASFFTGEFHNIEGIDGCISIVGDIAATILESGKSTEELNQAEIQIAREELASGGNNLANLTLFHDSAVHDIAISLDGTLIATGSKSGTVAAWDTETGENIFIQNGHTDTIKSVVFDPKSESIVTGSLDRNLRFWSISGELEWSGAYPLPIYSVAISPDGSRTTVGTGTSTFILSPRPSVYLYNSETGGQPLTIGSISLDAFYEVVAHSPTNNLMLTSYRGVVSPGNTYLRSSDSGEVILEINTQFEYILDAAFSPNGETFATAQGNTAKIWSVDTGESLLTFSHDSLVTAVAFSPDGALFLTGTSNNSVFLRNFSDGKIIGRYNGHEQSITAVRFFPDGRKFATAALDGQVCIWSIDGGVCSSYPNKSPSGFDKPQCTWGVDILAAEAGWNLSISWPSAGGRDAWLWWDLVTNATKSQIPAVGSIMVVDEQEGWSVGHVAYVTAVNGPSIDGRYTITINHSNFPKDSCLRMDTATIIPGTPTRFRINNGAERNLKGFLHKPSGQVIGER